MVVLSKEFIHLALWNPSEVVVCMIITIIADIGKASQMISVEEVCSHSLQTLIHLILLLSHCEISQRVHLG